MHRMVSELRQAAHRGHQRTGSLAQRLSAVSDLVVAAMVPSPQGVAANIAAGNFPKVISAGRVTYFNLSVLRVKPATVFSPIPFSIENLPVRVSVN